MRKGAAPRVIFGLGRNSRPDRVEFDITGGGKGVMLVGGKGGEPVLPKMAPPLLAKVNSPCVLPMRLRYRFTQSIRVGGAQEQMDMVGHEAIGPDACLRLPASFGKVVEICEIVFIAEKGLLPPVSSLGDMMRNRGDDNSCYSCQKENLYTFRRWPSM